MYFFKEASLSLILLIVTLQIEIFLENKLIISIFLKYISPQKQPRCTQNKIVMTQRTQELPSGYCPVRVMPMRRQLLTLITLIYTTALWQLVQRVQAPPVRPGLNEVYAKDGKKSQTSVDHEKKALQRKTTPTGNHKTDLNSEAKKHQQASSGHDPIPTRKSALQTLPTNHLTVPPVSEFEFKWSSASTEYPVIDFANDKLIFQPTDQINPPLKTKDRFKSISMPNLDELSITQQSAEEISELSPVFEETKGKKKALKKKGPRRRSDFGLSAQARFSQSFAERIELSNGTPQKKKPVQVQSNLVKTLPIQQASKAVDEASGATGKKVSVSEKMKIRAQAQQRRQEIFAKDDLMSSDEEGQIVLFKKSVNFAPEPAKIDRPGPKKAEKSEAKGKQKSQRLEEQTEMNLLNPPQSASEQIDIPQFTQDVSINFQDLSLLASFQQPASQFELPDLILSDVESEGEQPLLFSSNNYKPKLTVPQIQWNEGDMLDIDLGQLLSSFKSPSQRKPVPMFQIPESPYDLFEQVFRPSKSKDKIQKQLIALPEATPVHESKWGDRPQQLRFELEEYQELEDDITASKKGTPRSSAQMKQISEWFQKQFQKSSRLQLEEQKVIEQRKMRREESKASLIQPKQQQDRPTIIVQSQLPPKPQIKLQVSKMLQEPKIKRVVLQKQLQSLSKVQSLADQQASRLSHEQQQPKNIPLKSLKVIDDKLKLVPQMWLPNNQRTFRQIKAEQQKQKEIQMKILSIRQPPTNRRGQSTEQSDTYNYAEQRIRQARDNMQSRIESQEKTIPSGKILPKRTLREQIERQLTLDNLVQTTMDQELAKMITGLEIKSQIKAAIQHQGKRKSESQKIQQIDAKQEQSLKQINKWKNRQEEVWKNLQASKEKNLKRLSHIERRSDKHQIKPRSEGSGRTQKQHHLQRQFVALKVPRTSRTASRYRTLMDQTYRSQEGSLKYYPQHRLYPQVTFQVQNHYLPLPSGQYLHYQIHVPRYTHSIYPNPIPIAPPAPRYLQQQVMALVYRNEPQSYPTVRNMNPVQGRYQVNSFIKGHSNPSTSQPVYQTHINPQYHLQPIPNQPVAMYQLKPLSVFESTHIHSQPAHRTDQPITNTHQTTSNLLSVQDRRRDVKYYKTKHSHDRSRKLRKHQAKLRRHDSSDQENDQK